MCEGILLKAFPDLRKRNSIFRLLQMRPDALSDLVCRQFGAQIGEGLRLAHHVEGVVNGTIFVTYLHQPRRVVLQHLRDVVALEVVRLCPLA